MSRRTLIGFLLACCGTTAAAEPFHDHQSSSATEPMLRLGDTNWEIFRPMPCRQRIFDLAYLTDGLRAQKPGVGLRFQSTGPFTIDLRFDPISDRNDFIGPVYDRHIGATTLSIAFNF